MLHRQHLTAIIVIFLSVMIACGKKQTPPASAGPPTPPLSVAPAEQVPPPPAGTSQSILQKTFNLKTSAMFPFEIPAHTLQPHLHGIFQSFAGQLHGPSDDTANVDFLIMNEEQQVDFASNRATDVLFSIEASHNQSVNFDLPSSVNQPAKYYLVFRSAQSGKTTKVVEANFRLDF